MTKFETGTVVQLKSGGPKMSCTGKESQFGIDNGDVHCQWFSGGKLNSDLFPSDSLKIVDESANKKK